MFKYNMTGLMARYKQNEFKMQPDKHLLLPYRRKIIDYPLVVGPVLQN